MNGTRRLLLALGLVFAANAPALSAQHKSDVGIAAKIEQLVLPGSKLEAIPRSDERLPIVLRVLAAFPHGTAHRYDLEFYGLEPGNYDLKTYLRRVDRTSTADLPAIPVEIRAVLAPDQILPTKLETTAVERLGGYSVLLWIAGVVWVVGLLVILFGWRRKKVDPTAATEHVVTLADRLRPSVEAAIAGNLSSDGMADLERMLLTYWRRRLDLRDVKAGEAIARLREHDNAGPLLKQLENWLHRPGPTPDVDVAALLRPYQDLPAETEAIAVSAS